MRYKKKQESSLKAAPIPSSDQGEGPVNHSEFKVYTILPSPNPGGLYVMRELLIRNGSVVWFKDNVDDLWGIQMAKVQNALELAHES